MYCMACQENASFRPRGLGFPKSREMPSLIVATRRGTCTFIKENVSRWLSKRNSGGLEKKEPGYRIRGSDCSGQCQLFYLEGRALRLQDCNMILCNLFALWTICCPPFQWPSLGARQANSVVKNTLRACCKNTLVQHLHRCLDIECDWCS